MFRIVTTLDHAFPALQTATRAGSPAAKFRRVGFSLLPAVAYAEPECSPPSARCSVHRNEPPEALTR